MARPFIRGGVALAVGGTILAMAACSADSVDPAVEKLETARALNIATGSLGEHVDLAAVGGTDGVEETHLRLTLEPGSGTGVHCHHGHLVVVVEQGELTHYADAYHGGVHVYRAGDSVVEDARYVHETVNEGSEDLVLTVTHFTPKGKPMEERDLSKCEQ